ncbi:MAG: TolC family outer membrane protein [Sphingomonadaceae bacterium]|nr:TolC family outer membrane protein [Sphingomonadaceae bacterium]
MTDMKLVPAITAALLAATASLIAVAAGAETLPEALAEAYETNPQLAVQRAIVRQADELVPIALGAGRPTLDATAAEQQNNLDFNNNGRTMSSGLTINQSLFRGGRTRSATNAADNRILAARARLRAVEDNVLLGVVTAYADVLRYAAVVDLNTNQVKVLRRELQASRDRFEVGDLTRTDVAQSDARLANAQSNLVIAQGQLNTARNAYARVVGHRPGTLAPLPPLPALPGTSGQAVDLANANNPALVAARFDEAAARYDVSTIERERLPSVGLGLGANYQRFDGGGGGGRFVQQGGFFTQNAGVQLSVPLYQAGVVGARIRSAQAVRSQSMEQIGLVGRQVAETAQNAFVSVATARAVITASESSVAANTLALEGVSQENQVGTRTVLEVLNAEQELVVARVNLAAARRDEYVAGYTLLAAVGEAEVEPLAVPAKLYDSTANAARVRHKWNDHDTGVDVTPLPAPEPAVASKSIAIGPPR